MMMFAFLCMCWNVSLANDENLTLKEIYEGQSEVSLATLLLGATGGGLFLEFSLIKSFPLQEKSTLEIVVILLTIQFIIRILIVQFMDLAKFLSLLQK